MKKTYTTMMVGLMAGMVMLAGCKREYGTVTLGANIENGRDAKVYIDDLTPCWHNNDLIRVNNQTCTTSAALGSSAQITDVVESNHYRAIYPADIVGDVDISSSSTIAVTLPRVQQYEVDSRGDQKVKVPMGAYSDNESLTFHNLCPLIKIVVSNQTNEDFILDHITIEASRAYLSGLGSATVTGSPNDAVGMMDPSVSSHDVTLRFLSTNRPAIGLGDRDTYVFYIVAPEFEEDNLAIKLYSTRGYFASFEKRASLRHNRMAVVNLTVEQWDGYNPSLSDGVLPGAFSVGTTRQVHFSQGNMQYQASTNTWRFAEHQYDYVGSANSNISSTYSGWIDLFGWGTSGWNSGAICYQPWSTSTSYDDYHPGGDYHNNLTGSYVEADWAWHNSISNGGNAVHLWRTLSLSEWQYLFNTRPNASAKWGIGNINGVAGLIILPDSWTLPSGCLFISGIPSNHNTGWQQNNYTLAQWVQMESAGAVFLPASGRRSGTNFESSEGNYWTASTISNNIARKQGVNVSSSNLGLGDGAHRYMCFEGLSVRPVQDEE